MIKSNFSSLRHIDGKPGVKSGFIAGPQGLFAGLISYWKLDELGPGSRADSNGGNTLTDATNAVGHDNASGVACTPKAGFVHCAGGFGQVANTSRLKITDAAQVGLGMGSGKSFTIACWTYGNSGSTGANCIGKWSGTAGQQDYGLFVQQQSDTLYYYNVTAFNLGGTQITLQPPNGSSAIYRMNASAWRFLVWGYDDANQRLHITADTDCSAGNFPKYTTPCVGVRETACDFQVGSLNNGALAWWGSLDEVGFWNRMLTVADVVKLYAGGAGLPFGSFT